MGNPTIYYYPETALSADRVGLLEKIDFAEPISDIQIDPIRTVFDSVSLSGRCSRTSWRGGIQVRIVLERFTNDDLARDLYSLSSHVERGFHFGFAQDSAKAVAVTPHGSGWSRGSTVLAGSTNIFSKWEGSADLAADDIVSVSGPNPSHNREEQKLATWSMGSTVSNLTTSRGLRYDHTYPAVMRHRDFFPVLYVPQASLGAPALTHDHRISWTFDLKAILYPSWAAALATQSDSGLAQATSDKFDAGTLDQVVSSGITIPPDGPGVADSFKRIEPKVTSVFQPKWWLG